MIPKKVLQNTSGSSVTFLDRESIYKSKHVSFASSTFKFRLQVTFNLRLIFKLVSVSSLLSSFTSSTFTFCSHNCLPIFSQWGIVDHFDISTPIKTIKGRIDGQRRAIAWMTPVLLSLLRKKQTFTSNGAWWLDKYYP